MKISTNPIGNYGPSYIQKMQQQKTSVNTAPVKDKISVEEKKFFANMYPTNQNEIMEYDFYNLKGKVSGMHVGSLFDKRG